MSEKEETNINSSSWIMVDEIEKVDDEVSNKTEDPDAASRETVEDIVELDESDGISIISEPEEGSSETGIDSIEDSTDSKAKDQLIPCDKSEIVIVTTTESKPIISTNGLTSAGFMILGLLIALYFQKGSYDVISSDKEYNSIKSNEQEYELNDFNEPQDIEYIEDDAKRFYEKNNIRYDKQYAPPVDIKKTQYDNKEQFYKDKHFHKESGKKKYKYENDHNDRDKQRNFKKYKGSSEERNDYLHKNARKLQEQEDYLIKKQHKLKKKEEKLKQREMKINARHYSDESSEEYVKLQKNKKRKPNKKFSGDWYDNMHNGRNQFRKHQHTGDWYFDRAEYRNKKRDKANWYFNWMDDRENIRVKQSD